VIGGRRVSDLPGYYLEPTIFTGVHAEHRISTEEVFGPVLTVTPFEDEEDAIRTANGVDYGLAAGVYTSDLSRAHRVASRLQSGTVFVNGWYMGGMEAPFGGFKRSGYGRVKSLAGLANYSQIRNVAVRRSTRIAMLRRDQSPDCAVCRLRNVPRFPSPPDCRFPDGAFRPDCHKSARVRAFQTALPRYLTSYMNSSMLCDDACRLNRRPFRRLES